MIFVKEQIYFKVVSSVYCEVYNPLIISMSFITGTGFIKCIPITFSGLLVQAAILVIDIEEVFDANIESFFTN